MALRAAGITQGVPSVGPTRRNLETYLVRPNNFAQLEGLALERTKSYVLLRDQKEKRDLGEWVRTSQDVQRISSYVFRDVDDLLGLTAATHPEALIFDEAMKKGLSKLGNKVFWVSAGLSLAISPPLLYLLLGSMGASVLGGLVMAGFASLFLRALTQYSIIMQLPNFGFGLGGFNIPWTGVIGCAAQPTVKAEYVLAHEYGHTLYPRSRGPIQKVIAPCRGSLMAGEEGFAHGIQRWLVSRYASRNPAHHFFGLEYDAVLLYAAYKLTCEKLSKTPLPEIENPADSQKPLVWTDHILGNAAFSIAEARHGTQIYRQVLENDFSFLVD